MSIPLSSTKRIYNNSCGINPDCIKELNKSIIDYDSENASDNHLIELINCLINNEIDESLLTIQLSIFIRLITIIREFTDENNNIKKILEYANLYCNSYVRDIYRTFIIKCIDIDKEETINFYIKQFKDIRLHKLIESCNIKDINIDKFYNVIGFISFLTNYVNINSSYKTENNTIFDYLTQVIDINDKKFNEPIGKRLKNKHTCNKPSLIDILDANYYDCGCNCQCKTLMFYTLMRLLILNNQTINELGIKISDIKNIQVAGKETNSQNHIFIGINITNNDNSQNIKDYFYFEITSDTKDKPIINIAELLINQHHDHSINSNDYYLSNDKLYYIIIGQYLISNITSISDWVKKSNENPDKYSHLLSDISVSYGIILYNNTNRLIKNNSITIINRLDKVILLLNCFNKSKLIRNILNLFINNINSFHIEIDKYNITNKYIILEMLNKILNDYKIAYLRDNDESYLLNIKNLNDCINYIKIGLKISL